MGLRTPLSDLLGIAVPIVQAPIGSATCPALVAAVAEAGALGLLALSWRDRPEIKQQVDATHGLTQRPFGVNLVLAWPQQDRLAQCLDLGVKIVATSWGDPSPYVSAIQAAGGVLIHQVGTVDDARKAADAGADVIVAQGWEAGGHVQSEVGTLALVPRVVDAVAPLPVLAAGGIADGRGVAAALTLGAAGAWIGTRFLASEEAAVHHAYKQRLLEASENDTLYTCLFDLGWPDAPHRVIRNSTVERWEQAGFPASGRRPREGEPVASFPDGRPITRYSDVIPLPGMQGDVEALALYAGQGVGLISHVLPAWAIVARLVEETRAAMESAGKAVGR
jgi:nitronate monooxygenase